MKYFLFLLLCCSLNFANAVDLIPSKNVKLVVFVPESHADIVRKAMSDAGAGKIGNYDSCSFTIKGEGRWRPLEGANPYSGTVGKLYSETEDRIECVCAKENLDQVIQAIKGSHPYESVGIDIYPLLEIAVTLTDL